jgi:SAM-dependent methyltransferase
MSVFIEIHQDNPREGPGDNASTRKALEMIPGLPSPPKILDIGCGPGMQTLELARISKGHITALDSYQPFLEQLKYQAAEAGLTDNIRTVNESMFSMDFEEKFDLIWTEGSIYIIGFREGLHEWKELLKPQGYLAASEIVWLKPNPPEVIKKFWTVNYPAMQTSEDNSRVIEKEGYKEIGKFVLPESAWWDYYNPILKRVSILRAKYSGLPEVIRELDAQQNEIAMYRKYHDYFGYEFYVMQLAR